MLLKAVEYVQGQTSESLDVGLFTFLFSRMANLLLSLILALALLHYNIAQYNLMAAILNLPARKNPTTLYHVKISGIMVFPVVYDVYIQYLISFHSLH